MTAPVDWMRVDWIPWRTERLTLRLPTEADTDLIVAGANDPEVALKTANIPLPYERQDAETFIELSRAGFEKGRSLSLVAAGREDDRLIGCGGLFVDWLRNSGVIGYWLAKPHWGQGYGSEIGRALVEIGFERLGLERMEAAALPDNPASIRVQEKLGMRYFMSRTDDAPARDKPQQVVVRQVFRRDYLATTGRVPTVLVAAVALIDPDGRVLLAQRPEGKTMAGLWEFPGGKVRPGETPEAALIRELDEELDVDTKESCLAPLSFASHRYDDFHLLMPLYACRRWWRTPRPCEGQVLKWVRPRDMKDYPMPPADKPLVAVLRDWL